jgi:exodeoxyribonuclease VII large subunit
MLNRLARTCLEDQLGQIRVAGEISNLTRAASGHMYFTLKDDQAQVRCTMWRNRAQTLAFRPENGMRIEARATVTLYEVRGDYQLSVDTLRQAGTGDLFEAFLRLKERLAAQGLFDPVLKRALPRYPRRIGVVTSPAAAAFQDVLATLRRRAPHLEIVLYPSPVQGDSAAAGLADALRTASTRAPRDQLDLVLLVRGGGSLEDLWSFNDEALAHAIRACAVPVVSGVGHETDFTIADFAADVRAATPTGAAEIASAGYHEAGTRLVHLQRHLSSAMQSRLATLAQRVDRASLKLLHPSDRLKQSSDVITRLKQQLGMAMYQRLERMTVATNVLQLRLKAGRPELKRETERCARLGAALRRTSAQIMRERGERLAALAAHLEHLDPQAVLTRGYSIARAADGTVLRAAHQTTAGASVTVQLAHGHLQTTVTATE